MQSSAVVVEIEQRAGGYRSLVIYPNLFTILTRKHVTLELTALKFPHARLTVRSLRAALAPKSLSAEFTVRNGARPVSNPPQLPKSVDISAFVALFV